MNWKPIRKVFAAGVAGPIITAGLAWLTGAVDWRVPLAALLTAAIAYLVPSPAPKPKPILADPDAVGGP